MTDLIYASFPFLLLKIWFSLDDFLLLLILFKHLFSWDSVATVPYRILFLMVQIPIKGFKIMNSEVLSWAYCDSSKPGRSATRYMLVCCLNTFIERNDQVLRYVSIIDYFWPSVLNVHSERWVLHSTAEYANSIIAQTGFLKPSEATLTRVAEDLFRELQNTGLNIPQPFFKKAHRWSVHRLKF